MLQSTITCIYTVLGIRSRVEKVLAYVPGRGEFEQKRGCFAAKIGDGVHRKAVTTIEKKKSIQMRTLRVTKQDQFEGQRSVT